MWHSARSGCVRDDITVYFWVPQTSGVSHVAVIHSPPDVQR